MLVVAAACGSDSNSAQTTATSPSDQATESTSDTTAPVQTDPTTPTTSAATFTRTWTLSLQASDGAAYTALYELGDVVPASTGLVNGYEPGNACQVDRQRDAVAAGRMTIRNNSTFSEGLHVDVFMASKDLKLLGGESTVGTNSRTVSYTGKQDLQAEVYVSPPECTKLVSVGYGVTPTLGFQNSNLAPNAFATVDFTLVLKDYLSPAAPKGDTTMPGKVVFVVKDDSTAGFTVLGVDGPGVRTVSQQFSSGKAFVFAPFG